MVEKEMVNNARKIRNPFSYKFKYIYLVLGLIFVTLIIATYYLPKKFPAIFTDDSWNVVPDNDVNPVTVSIEHISENTAMMILEIIRSVSTSGFIGVVLYAFYEYRFAKDEKQALIDNVNTILSENIEPHIVHAVLNDKDTIKKINSSQWIDEILYTCLIQKTGDEGKASAIMKLLLENVIQSMTIWDLDVSMTLEDFSDPKHLYCAYDTYKLTYVIRYKVFLNANSFTFILTNNQSVQSGSLSAFAFCQFIDSSFSGQEVYFKVNQITIEGISLTLQGERENSSDYVREEYWDNSCNNKMGEKVQVVYSVKFLIRKKGNHYSYFTPAMTNNIHLKFDASKTDIKRIKLLQYFNSKEKPTILFSEDESNPKVIEIMLNDWTLPLSGAAFIWQFERK